MAKHYYVVHPEQTYKTYPASSLKIAEAKAEKLLKSTGARAVEIREYDESPFGKSVKLVERNPWPFGKRQSPGNFLPAHGGIAQHMGAGGTKSKASGDVVATVKGHQIVKQGRQFYVPSLDPGPFAKLGDAELFIASIVGGGKVKNPNKRLRTLLEKLTKDQQDQLVRSIDRFYYAAIGEGFSPREAQTFAEKRAIPEARKLSKVKNPGRGRTIIPVQIKIERGGKVRVFATEAAIRKLNGG